MKIAGGFKSLQEISELVTKLSKKVKATKADIPTFGHSIDFGYSHVEVDENGYHYVTVERGKEIQRLTTAELEELLFHIFDDVTSEIARRFETKNRESGRDSRRSYFAKQEELLTQLLPIWGARSHERHETILKDNPFDDNAVVRAQLCKTFQDEGMSGQRAWELACEKYPLPIT